MACEEIKLWLQCLKSTGATYGEFQAVIQLSIALNVGIFVVTDLALPYLERQRKDLANLRLIAGAINNNIIAMPEGPERDDKKNKLDAVLSKINTIVPRSSGLKRGSVEFVFSLTLGAAILAFVGLVLLFESALKYGDLFPFGHVVLTGGMFVPLVIGTISFLMARIAGSRIIKEQDSIRDELDKLI